MPLFTHVDKDSQAVSKIWKSVNHHQYGRNTFFGNNTCFTVCLRISVCALKNKTFLEKLHHIFTHKFSMKITAVTVALLNSVHVEIPIRQ